MVVETLASYFTVLDNFYSKLFIAFLLAL